MPSGQKDGMDGDVVVLLGVVKYTLLHQKKKKKKKKTVVSAFKCLNETVHFYTLSFSLTNV